MDGTFRLVFGDYVVLCLGVLSKQWSQKGKESCHLPCGSTFNEIGFAICRKESELSYSALVSAVYEVAASLGLPTSLADVRQWHADMRLGIRKARQTLASHAHSVDDWAHVVGATSSRGMGGARKHVLDARNPHCSSTRLSCPLALHLAPHA